MTEREQLWYLIDGLIKDSYDIQSFCSEFTRIYDLETDYEVLSADENREFGDLCEIAGRFSNDTEDLKRPNVYFSENDIKQKVQYIVKVLKKMS